MAAHSDWIASGMKDGVFLVVGSLQPNLGGAVIMHGLTREDAEARLAEDPFVAHGVVQAELLEISPAKVDDRLSFLLD